MTTVDTSHLESLEIGLSHERSRLANAKTEQEREIRKVWVAQLEKEVAHEKKFLGIEEVPVDDAASEISDDDLLNELLD